LFCGVDTDIQNHSSEKICAPVGRVKHVSVDSSLVLNQDTGPFIFSYPLCPLPPPPPPPFALLPLLPLLLPFSLSLAPPLATRPPSFSLSLFLAVSLSLSLQLPP